DYYGMIWHNNDNWVF
nr:immunoglobulin light chain junction region [Macaca mulatta]